MSLDPENVLLAVAEVAVAFVGFASLVALFLARGEEVSVLRIRGTIQPLLDYGLWTLVACLLPFVLVMAQQPPEMVWTVPSAVMAVGVTVQNCLYLYFSRGELRTALETNPTGWLMFAGDAVAVVALASNALGWPFDSGLPIYFYAAVLWNLFNAALAFRRLVSGAWEGRL